MYDHARIALIIVVKEMPSHCCVIVMFNVINMTLESVNFPDWDNLVQY